MPQELQFEELSAPEESAPQELNFEDLQSPEPKKRESGVSPSLLQLPFGSDWPAGEAPTPKEMVAQFQEPNLAIPSAVVNPQGGRAQAVAKESYNLVKSVPEFFSSPMGVGTLVNAPFLGRLVPAAFFLQTLGQMGEEGRRLKENYDTMTPAERWGAYTRIVGSGVFAGLMGKAATHVVPEAPVPPVLKRGLLPEATKAAEEAGVKVEEKPYIPPPDEQAELQAEVAKAFGEEVATEESSLPAVTAGEGELVAPEQTAQAPSKAPEAVVAATGEPAMPEGGAKVAQSQPEVSYAKGKVEETGGVPAVERVPADRVAEEQAQVGTAQRGSPGEEAQSELPLKFPNTGAGSPADQFGAIYGPTLNKQMVEKLSGHVGESFDLPSEAGTKTTLKVKPNMIWVESEKRVPGPVNEYDVGVAYLKVRANGETVLDASKHNRPIDKQAADALMGFLSKFKSEKTAKGPETRLLSPAASGSEKSVQPATPATREEVQAPKIASEQLKITGTVSSMSPGDIHKAILGSVVEGGMIQGIKEGGDRTGHYVVIPPDKTVPGDEPMAMGPFVSRKAAKEFMDSEVGAPGAKIVEVTKSPVTTEARQEPQAPEVGQGTKTTADVVLAQYHRYKEAGDGVGAFTMKRVLERLPAEEVDAAIERSISPKPTEEVTKNEPEVQGKETPVEQRPGETAGEPTLSRYMELKVPVNVTKNKNKVTPAGTVVKVLGSTEAGGLTVEFPGGRTGVVGRDWLREVRQQPTPSQPAIAAKEGEALTIQQSLSTLPSVKVKVPEGATQIRITTPQGKKAVQSVASVNKGDNPFRGVDIKKVEAGTIDKKGKFKPIENQELLSVGPGAQTAGEAPYPAISQLTDQLNGVKNKGVRESLSARDKIASVWSKGKSLTDSSIALMRAASTTAKEMFRGIRDINDLERNLSKFDDVLQTSSGRSVQAKRQMLRQVKSETDRNAAALLVDSGFDQTKIADALSRLPAGTDPVIRKAMERASNPTEQIEDFAHSIEQFFSLRERDARLSDIFENGLRDYYTHIWQKEQNMPDRLRAALTSGRVSTYFQFSRQRQIPTLIEGILLGKKPILDPAKVVPFYNYAMDRSIASRELVKSLTDVTMSDGRPLVEVSGVGKVVDSGTKPTVIIKPKVKSGEMQGYEVVNHPAMKAWKWVTQSEDGTPVILQGDLLVHPEGFERLARIMDRHRLTPTATMRNLLRVGGEVKGFKLGLLSAFHDVHVASHAAWHWTNPFKSIKGEVDFDDPFTHFAIEKGHVKLAPNPAELNVFSEGIGPSSLAEKVPLGIGRVSKAHAEWLFGTFIPNLKLNTFRNAYNRAIWMRENMGSYKGLSDEQIASRIGDSVNSAYGELNQMFMGKYGRDPSFQRLLRLIFLAPDFGEARLRFVGKAFTRYGHEERIALATMALGLYAAARVGNWLSHGDPEFKDIENSFRVKAGNQWWSMRSVIGDVLHAIERPGQFFYVRLNPVYSRTLADLTFGRDAYTGRKLTAVDKAKRLGEQIIPINVTPLTKKDREWWHSLTQSIGVYATRDTAAMDISKLASEWNLKQGKPQPPEFIPGDEASYSKLRMALQINNQRYAKQVLTDLLKSRSSQKVAKAMEAYVHHPFTGNRKDDFAFYATLTDLQKKQYAEALKQRKETWEKFKALMAERNK